MKIARGLSAVAGVAAALAGCGHPAHVSGPAIGGPLPASYIALCGGDQVIVVDPADGRVVQVRTVVMPTSQFFQPTIRQESAASRLGPTAPPPSDCGTWSYDGDLTHLAGSSEGRLATWYLTTGYPTPVSPPVRPGSDSPVCCAIYDPTSEALWHLHSAGAAGTDPGYVAVGPDGTTGPTFYGTNASITFPSGSADPSVGVVEPTVTLAGLTEVSWQPLPTTEDTALPPKLSVTALDYGLAGTLSPWGKRVGVLRHADSGSGVAFVASSGRDCTLYTVAVSGGRPTEVGVLPYTPTPDGSAGCGDEVIRYHP